MKSTSNMLRNGKTPSKSPSNPIFVRFQNDWDSLNKDTSGLLLLEYSEISDELKANAESVASWGEKLYEENVFPREDYRELLELTLVYLDAPVYPLSFRKPG
jgi:hypothetical protein